MRRRIIGVGILLVAALALLPGGCGKDKSTKPETSSDCLAQSSAQNCLANLIRAYTHRNIDEYRKLFSSDFLFEPSPIDVIGPGHLPAQWGLADELEIHTHMFDPHYERTVDRIDLVFTQDPPAVSDDEYPNTWKAAIRNIQLRVETRTSDGSQINYQVIDGRASFYFKEYPGEVAGDGQPLWRIVRWKDEPAGLLARGKSEKTRWAMIKAVYK